MRRKICFSIILLAAAFRPIAQTPAEMLAYLKKNITVYYIANPNTNEPDIRQIKPAHITLSSKGIIFGKTDNGGMDFSAQLLTALFSEKNTNPKDALIRDKDADMRLQETIYHAMQITGKPITVFFINDKYGGVLYQYAANYSMYLTKSMTASVFYVWPGVFSMKTGGVAGAIVLGEYLFLKGLSFVKEEFINMVIRAQAGSFGPMKTKAFITINSKHGDYPVIMGVNDVREITNEAIANTFNLYYSQAYRNDVGGWQGKGGYFFLKKESKPDEIYGSDINVIIPAAFTLQNRILKLNQTFTGYSKEIFHLDRYEAMLKTYSLYSNNYFIVKEEAGRFKILSDLYLGTLFYQYVRKFGLQKFVESITYDSGSFLKANPEQRTGILLENMCIVLARNRTTAGMEAELKGAGGAKILFPLVLFTYFGMSLNDNPKGSIAKNFLSEYVPKTGGVINNRQFPTIALFYTDNWATKIAEYYKQYRPEQPPPGLTLIESDADVLARALGMN
ncbi:MAG: hypothetical protein ACT4OJ_04625 [Bacteroidota bacterium]